MAIATLGPPLRPGADPASVHLLPSSASNALGTITADVSIPPEQLAATSQSASLNTHPSSAPGATPSIWTQSAHPVALFCLFLFRSLAVATYLLCGFFSDSYVFSTVMVVILLSADFWTVRNVSGRVLVGLRFWNQVDEDGTSYWVFESRDPSLLFNAVDSKMFWTALYVFPVAWVCLLFIGILKFNLSFLPIDILALVFNLTNTIGFTYADRDAKRKWATGMSSGATGLLNHLGSNLFSGLAKAGMGKMFG